MSKGEERNKVIHFLGDHQWKTLKGIKDFPIFKFTSKSIKNVRQDILSPATSMCKSLKLQMEYFIKILCKSSYFIA